MDGRDVEILFQYMERLTCATERIANSLEECASSTATVEVGDVNWQALHNMLDDGK